MRRSFGYVDSTPTRLRFVDAEDQTAALLILCDLARRSVFHPSVREAALAVTGDCAARDDACEIEAVFNAVKHGDPRVKGLAKGFRYVADPIYADTFTTPARSLALTSRGAAGGDCDDASMLTASMLGAIGFDSGLCAWGKTPKDYEHVFAVTKYPKRPNGKQQIIALDTTVKESYAGWHPPRGAYKIVFLGEAAS